MLFHGPLIFNSQSTGEALDFFFLHTDVPVNADLGTNYDSVKI